MNLKKHIIVSIRCLTLTFVIGIGSAWGQVSDREKLDNQLYYQGFIKENINFMREYVDSTNVKLMLNSMEQINDKIGTELAKIVVEEDEMELTVDTMAAVVSDDDVSLEDMETADEDISLDGEAMDDEKIDDIFAQPESEDGDSSPLDKLIPASKRLKTNFIINYGLNFINAETTTTLSLAPKNKTWSSWFWEYGIQSKVRLGKPGTRVFLTYGVSYFKNRFTLDNNVILSIVEGPTDAPVPAFIKLDNLTASPKMRIGYVQVPIGLRVKIAKKSYIEAGGYVGYRLFTSQTHELDVNNEKIITKRSGDYMMNDWIYGITAGLKVGETRLVARYNLNGIFKENLGLQAKPFSIGFNVSI